MKAPNFLLSLSGFSKYKYDPVTGTVWSFVRKEPRPLQWCMVDKYGTRKIVSPINDDGAKVPLTKSQVKMYVCMNTNAAGLKKGDRVLIDPKLSKLALELGVGSGGNREHSDYDNCWTDEMRQFIGKEGTVIDVFDEDGVAVRTDGTQSYCWPADVLKKIEKTETPIDAGNLLTVLIEDTNHSTFLTNELTHLIGPTVIVIAVFAITTRSNPQLKRQL
jgi:hypothetical protein